MWQYLSPDNAIAKRLVRILIFALIFLFALWFLGWINSWLMNPDLQKYLTPDNLDAKRLVRVLKFVFVLWFSGLIDSGFWLWVKRREMSKCEDVETLVKARQERTVEKETDMRIASGPSVPQYQQDIQKSQTWVQQEPQPQETPIRQEAQSQPLSHLMQQRPQPQKAQHNLTPMQEFGHLYNAAVEDSKRHSEFAQRYQPVRIGVANAMERRRDSSKEPDFQTSPYGDYFAVVVEGGTRYAVVPRFALTFQESSYGPGAMGQVFECPNYDIRQRYPRVKVVKPAVFEPDPARQRWTLKEKGVLDLGQGE